MLRLFSMSLVVGLVMTALVGTASADLVMQAGGDRLVAMQQNDGGWDWPLNDGNPNSANASNTAGPIGMGLLSSYARTGDVSHYNAAVAAGAFVRDVSPPHSTGNGIFMHALSELTGDAQYANDVKTEYYDALAAGTYNRSGTDYNTLGYAQYIQAKRIAQTSSGYSLGNLGIWDLGLAAVGAHRLGADASDWVTVIKDQLNAWTSSSYYDVIGLAGGVWALAELGEDFDPTAGGLAAADSLADLAAMLAGFQIDETGGFPWNSNYWNTPGQEDVQDTAYVILALDAFDAELYHDEIAAAGAYLRSSQLATGGWGASSENNEVTGEALWAIHTVPSPGAAVLGMLGLGLVGMLRKR